MRSLTLSSLVGLLTLVSAPAATNLLPNPSFENTSGQNPRGWRQERWGGEGGGRLADQGHTGSRSVSLTSERGADISWTATASVDSFSRYRLSGWIKTENVRTTSGRGALFNVHELQTVATPAVSGTTNWTQVQVEFDVEDQTSLQINCLLGGWGSATGTAYYDDVELVQLSRSEPPAPKISVTADRLGAPMPAAIYSQFIEHLGRCIYGGIWAEMLEDRKFYFPITAEYRPYRSLRNSPFPVVGASPWEIIGAAESVAMSKHAPFVGQHTPVILEGSGIRQRDLGVVQGRAYAGYAWLKSDREGPASVELVLRWGEGPDARQLVSVKRLTSKYRRAAFRFTAGATTDKASLELRARDGRVACGAISLMPADNIEGMRADTLVLLRELKAPIYRWPGGNFVSGYDWRDGIGDRDRRPPRTNPAWTGVEHNDMGMHEFIRFCRLVNAEPWITVNTGFGDVYSAAAQLEYCNGAASTPWGKRRAANGVREPYRVRYWGIGNEMWGTWQLGHMQLEHYVLKQNWVVDKMREVDPNIICIASGDIGPWSAGLLKNSRDHMDFVAEHFYCQERSGLAAHVRQIPDSIRRKADWHRRTQAELPELKGKKIPIAMTEWNYWYGAHVFGELGTRYFLKDGLGIAAGLHEYARQSDVVGSAFYAQTVNVIGAIKTSRRNAAFETTGLVLKMYRQHFGEVPATTATQGVLDAQAAWSRDRKTLTLGVVNPTLQAVQVPLTLTGARLKGSGTRWQIAGSDPMAYNDPDQPPRVVIEEQRLSRAGEPLALAPCSVTLFAFDVE